MIRQRVDSSGVSEAEITSQGNNIVVVAAGPPERGDAQARPDLGADGVPAGARRRAPRRRPRPRRPRRRRSPRTASTRRHPDPTPDGAERAAPSDEPDQGGPGQPERRGVLRHARRSRRSSTRSTAPTPRTAPVASTVTRTRPFVTCDQDGTAKYILGPVEIEGARISGAELGPRAAAQRRHRQRVGRQHHVRLQGHRPVHRRDHPPAGPQTPPQNQFAMVLDGLVISAPSLASGVIISNGKAEISGTFTRESRGEPGQPAQLRLAARCVRGAERGADLRDARFRAAAEGPDRRPHRPGAGRPLLDAPVPRARPGDGRVARRRRRR